MMKKWLTILFLFLNSCLLQAEEPIGAINFNKDDRVLILAPHPDDEAIGTGGVIQKAIKSGSKVKVVCFTNGDHNQLAFIVYEKRLTIRQGEFLYMGETRRKETILAMGSLGLSPNDIVFLGYPDFGTMEILTKYWGKTEAFKSILTRISKVSYPEAMSINAPYVGESILKDLKAVILDFKPTKIFVSHPSDTNRDHQALYLFLQIVLWDLEGQIQMPQVFPYAIHVIGWPKPRGYHPDLELESPGKLKGILWQKLPLTEDEIKGKYNAISSYKSQIKYNPPYLFTFVRKNELFGDYPQVRLQRGTADEIHWQDIEVQEDEEVNSEEKENNSKTNISALAYAFRKDSLFIRITLKRKIDKNLGISIFLLGYSKNKKFDDMPKIRISIGMFGMNIKDKRHPIFIKGSRIAYEKNSVILEIPAVSLGNPDHILCSVHTPDLPYDETVWRIIELFK